MHTSIRRGISTTHIALLSLAGFGMIAVVRAGAQGTPAAPATTPARRPPVRTQTASNAGTITGTVTDPSGAVVPNATVTLSNGVSGFTRTAKTDASGSYSIANVPFNTYRLNVTADTLAPSARTVELQSFVPVEANVTLPIAAASTTVEVTTSGNEMVEADPVGHTDVDRDVFSKIPLESLSSSISSVVTLASPGVSADSNGMFHGMGDHASNSFSVDGQPITDQQSKAFSNQIPMDSVQSLEVIPGAPSAEYGGKTSLVIVATTRSGMGNPEPHGEVNVSYGSFGSADVGFNLAYGKQKAGNFISANVLNTGRFLDPPEFHTLHDKGNEENLFDRVDYQVNPADSFHLNLGFTRSWFQTPNSYDNQYATQWPTNSAGVPVGPDGKPVGPTDQRAQIKTVNFAPSYTRILNPNTVLNTNYFFRRDSFNYYPSKNPFADRGAPDLQQETIGQQRTLANTGLLSDVTYTHGIHNVKAGVSYTQTFLTENFQLGIVDPTLLNPIDCFPGTSCATLLPYDLTRGGGLYSFHGHTDVKEFAAYAQDAISAGPWGGNFGLRFDRYNGLTVATQVEPRLALSYKIKWTGTVLRASYARTLESPFNENLVLASKGCSFPVIADLLSCASSENEPNAAGFRNDFHAGFEQSITKYAILSADYVWKYTHNAYDFSVLGATPITFPIGWNNSKIPGFDGRLDIPAIHNFTAQIVFSSVAARFFTPQTSGLGTTVGTPGSTVTHTPFRIDHDERFNQTTHAQYQLGKRGPYVGFNWRFDSGGVAGSAPCYGRLDSNNCVQSTTLNGQPAVSMQDAFGNNLTADQEAQAGFACNGVHPSLGHPLPSACLVSQFTSSLIRLVAPNTQNDDRNPARIASRNLFDLSFGEDNLFHRKESDKRTLSASVTIVNLTNKEALYNFLSTFSGTHFVTPRSITGEIAYHF
ncbi:MAG: TonB-dependent receptor [Acidobacteriota bacterium]|nr:TonB-dependent receptor [Acidobacteriota bacterium]